MKNYDYNGFDDDNDDDDDETWWKGVSQEHHREDCHRRGRTLAGPDSPGLNRFFSFIDFYCYHHHYHNF